MRYTVFADNDVIFDSEIESLKLIKADVNLELNKAGSFTFSLPPSHPYYNSLQRLKTTITIYQDNDVLFRGRILNTEYGFYNDMQITCEGELAFLLDTIQHPYDYQSGENHTTIAELFTQFITQHNSYVDESRRFIVGNITVTDGNDYIIAADSTYLNTWESINQKLIDRYGGYLWVRHEEDGNYIDYLEDFDTISAQAIEFGENLLDISKSIRGEDVITAIIPLGAKVDDESEERLTIADLPDESTGDMRKSDDYVYDVAAVAKYGYIFKTQTWDDVTVATNLLTKAKAQLANDINLDVSIELSAADLAGVDADITSFHLGTYIPVKTNPHGINDNYLVNKLSLSLLNPSTNKLAVGKNYKTFTESVTQNKMSTQNNYSIVQQNITKIENNYSLINKNVQEINDSYFSNTQADSLSQRVTQNATNITNLTSRISKLETISSVNLTPLNDWQNMTGYEIPAAHRNATGQINLRGVITSSGTLSNTSAFTLPLDFRPEHDELFMIGSYSIVVHSTGNIDITTDLIDIESHIVSLSGISFYGGNLT